jgi:hypothetical protein
MRVSTSNSLAIGKLGNLRLNVSALFFTPHNHMSKEVMHISVPDQRTENALYLYDSDAENLRSRPGDSPNVRQAEKSLRVLAARSHHELYEALEPHGA